MAIETQSARGGRIDHRSPNRRMAQAGTCAEKDENLVEIETDKATVELPAPVSGKIAKVLKRNGDTAAVGEVIGYMEEVASRARPRKTRRLPPSPKRRQASQTPAKKTRSRFRRPICSRPRRSPPHRSRPRPGRPTELASEDWWSAPICRDRSKPRARRPAARRSPGGAIRSRCPSPAAARAATARKRRCR